MAVYSKILELINGIPRTVDLSTNTFSVQGLQINAATGGGAITQAAHSSTTSYTIVWPQAQAASSGYVLTNDGSGNLSWAAASSPLVFSDSLVNTGGTVTLVNDTASPSANTYYGTNGSSVLGYYSLPVSGINQLTGDVTAGPGTGSQAATLATVNSDTGSFGSSTSIPSFTVNAKGLITAASGNAVIAPAGTLSGTTLNSTVTASSLTSLGTQSVALNMGSNQINNLANGVLSGDAVNYGQLTSISTGLIWQGSINDPDLVDDSLSTPPGSPVYSITYIIAASPTGAWTGCAGYATWWDGAEWIDLSTGNTLTSGLGTAVQIGARFLVASASPGGPANVGGSFSITNVGQVVTVTGNTPGSFTYSFQTPLNNWAVSDLDVGSQHNGDSFTYTTSGPYTFTVSSANATAGATYTNNGHTFTVTTTIVAGTLLLAQGTGVPTASGTLTKSSGTGDSTITFSSYTGSNWIDFAGPGKVLAGSALAYTGNTLNVRYDNSTIGVNGSNQLYVLNGGITNTQISTSAAIAFSKLAALPTGDILVGSSLSVATAVTVSGDATLSNTGALTLNTVNSDTGTFASVTVNGKGLVTAAAALSGDATTSGSTLTLATVNSNTGSFGSSTSIPTFTVNGKGLITAASGNAVVAPAGTLTGSTLNSTVTSSSLTSVGTISSGTWQGTAVGATYGGTGQSSYTTGDTLYASATNTLSKLAIGSTGQILTISGGVPTWASPATSGTVTSVSVVSANGFAGTVSNPSTTPAITISTTINSPVLAGNGTAISAATTTGTGSTVVLSASPTVTGTVTATNITMSGNLVVPTEQFTATYNGAATLSANTTYCLRWGIPANSETAGDLYMADWSTSSFDLYWVVGLYNNTSSTATGTSITVTSRGNFTLGSSDTTFGSSDRGKPAWLGASGAFTPNSTFSPASGDANFKLGIVTGSTTIYLDGQMMGVS